MSQNVALAATGFIWVRYSVVIIPVNYSLAAVRPGAAPMQGEGRGHGELMNRHQVNFFVGATGVGQLYRIWE